MRSPQTPRGALGGALRFAPSGQSPRVAVLAGQDDVRRWLEEGLGMSVASADTIDPQTADVLVADVEGVNACWADFAGAPAAGWPGILLACPATDTESESWSLEPAAPEADPASLLMTIVDDLVSIGCSRAELRRRVANVAAIRAARIQHRSDQQLRAVVRSLLGASLHPSLAILGFGAELLRQPQPPFASPQVAVPLARASVRTHIVASAAALAGERLGVSGVQPLPLAGVDLGILLERLRTEVFVPDRLCVERVGDGHCDVHRTLVQALVLAWAGSGGRGSGRAHARIVGESGHVVLRISQGQPARRGSRGRGSVAGDLGALVDFVAAEHAAECEVTVNGIAEATLRFARTASTQTQRG